MTGCTRRAFLLISCLFVLPALVWAQTTKPAGPERWEKAIAAFEAKDRVSAPAPGGILFVGSSSIVRWDLGKSFPDLTLINRGFGGSVTSDSVFYAERIILPYRPKTIVVYAGTNDIAAGKSPRQVVDDFKQLVAKVHAALPETKIIFIPLGLSPIRFHLADKFRETNGLLRQIIASDPLLTYVDMDKRMLAADGSPREELYVKDRLHLSEQGYEIWTDVLRPYLATGSAPATRP